MRLCNEKSVKNKRNVTYMPKSYSMEGIYLKTVQEWKAHLVHTVEANSLCNAVTNKSTWDYVGGNGDKTDNPNAITTASNDDFSARMHTLSIHNPEHEIVI